MSNEAKNLGDAVVDRETEQAVTWKVNRFGGGPFRFITDQHNNVIAERIATDDTARLIAAAPALRNAITAALPFLEAQMETHEKRRTLQCKWKCVCGLDAALIAIDEALALANMPVQKVGVAR